MNIPIIILAISGGSVTVLGFVLLLGGKVSSAAVQAWATGISPVIAALSAGIMGILHAYGSYKKGGNGNDKGNG